MAAPKMTLGEQFRLERTVARPALHKAQAELLEVAFRADIAITSVIAARLGRGVPEVIQLQDRLLPQLSIPTRLRLLREIMETESWSDEFPFVMPVLERLFTIRNVLAHSLTASMEAGTDGDWSFTRFMYRRGDAKEETFSISKLTYITRATERTLRDLDFVWVRSMPKSFWLDKSRPHRRDGV
jgi:hypothetical protein